MPLTLPWSGACRAPSWCASHEPNLLWESMSQNDVSFANTFFARLHLRALQGYAIRPYTLRQLTGNRCGRKSILTKSCAGIITFYYTTKNFIKDELNAHKMKVVTRRGAGGAPGGCGDCLGRGRNDMTSGSPWQCRTNYRHDTHGQNHCRDR